MRDRSHTCGPAAATFVLGMALALAAIALAAIGETKAAVFVGVMFSVVPLMILTFAVSTWALQKVESRSRKGS